MTTKVTIKESLLCNKYVKQNCRKLNATRRGYYVEVYNDKVTRLTTLRVA